MDCEQSCPKPAPVPPTPKPFTIFGMDGYKVCMAVLFVVLSTLFLIGVCLYPSKSMDGKLLRKIASFISINNRKRRTQSADLT